MNAHRNLLSTATLLALLSCGPALASDPAQPQEQGSSTAKATAPAVEEEELICRNERVTGSRKRQRLCHTQDEWDNMRTTAGSNTRRIQSQNTGLVEEGG